jgi:trehalose 6-phosphate phosphatase
MKDLLLPRDVPELARLLDGGGRPPLLAFDYDGVLAPIIRDPGGAPMTRRTRALLQELAARFPVAVVSGRSFAKLHRVVGTVVPFLVGNHGFEYLHRTPVPGPLLARVRRWEARMQADLEDVDGIHLEHKHSTFAVHYSQASDRRAGAQVVRAARALRGARIVLGKGLVNVLPASFPTKGDAVRKLLRHLGCRRALFVGDDVTDEDVFVLPRRLIFGVHVGPGPSRAAWRVPARRDVDALLETLLGLMRRAEIVDSSAAVRAPGRRATVVPVRPAAGGPR